MHKCTQNRSHVKGRVGPPHTLPGQCRHWPTLFRKGKVVNQTEFIRPFIGHHPQGGSPDPLTTKLQKGPWHFLLYFSWKPPSDAIGLNINSVPSVEQKKETKECRDPQKNSPPTRQLPGQDTYLRKGKSFAHSPELSILPADLLAHPATSKAFIFEEANCAKTIPVFCGQLSQGSWTTDPSLKKLVGSQCRHHKFYPQANVLVVPEHRWPDLFSLPKLLVVAKPSHTVINPVSLTHGIQVAEQNNAPDSFPHDTCHYGEGLQPTGKCTRNESVAIPFLVIFFWSPLVST